MDIMTLAYVPIIKMVLEAILCGVSIYAVILFIKALKIYINKNS